MGDDTVLPLRQFRHRQIAWAVWSMNSVFETAHPRRVAGKGTRGSGVLHAGVPIARPEVNACCGALRVLPHVPVHGHCGDRIAVGVGHLDLDGKLDLAVRV